MRRIRSLRTGVLAAVIALLFVGASAASAAQLSTWDQIHKTGVFRLGVTNSPPWSSLNPQTGKWSGLSVALGQEIAKALGVKLQLVQTTWANSEAALQANQIDAIFVRDATPQRALSVDFTLPPMLYYALAALHTSNVNATSWADLNSTSVHVAVPTGTTMAIFVQSHLPKAHIDQYPTNDATVAAFQSGRDNVAVLFGPPLTMEQKRVGMGQVTVPTPVHYSGSNAAVRQETDKRWRDFLSIALNYYYNSGTTETLYEDYLKSIGIDPSTVPPIMKELFPTSSH